MEAFCPFQAKYRLFGGALIYHFLYPRGGREQVGPAHNQLAIDPAEREWGYMPASWLASMDQIPVLMSFGGLSAYEPGAVTETKDNSSTIGAMPSGIGIRFQTQATPTDNDDVAATSVNGAALAAGKDWFGFCRVQMPDVANMGFAFGLVPAGTTEVFSSNPADGLYFIKAKNAAGLTLRVVENGQAADDLSLFTTGAGAGQAVSFSNNTDLVLGFHFRVGSSATSTVGEVWINGYRTPLSADQAAALANMLTTPPTLSAHVGFRVNGTTQKRGVVAAACVGCWR